MADTQHNLRIKATLDASQLQQEIDRLNGQKPGGGGGGASGAARSTSSLLSKLDSTLNRLNTTMQHMSQVMASSSRPGYASPAFITNPNLPNAAKTPPVVNNLPSNTPIAPAPQVARPRGGPLKFASGMNTDQAKFILSRSIFDANELSQKMFGKPIASLNANQIKSFAYQMLQDKNAPLSGSDARSALESIFGPNLTAGSKMQAFMAPGKKGGGPVNPPIVSRNVMRVFPDGSFQLIDRDEMPESEAAEIHRARARRRDALVRQKSSSWYRQVRLGWGLNMAGQIFGESAGLMNADEATQRSWQGVGNVISTAGMATMVHPIVGAFAFVATSALELAKSLKAAEEQAKVFAQRRSEAVDVARGGLNTYMAEKGVLGSPDYEQLVEKARSSILVDTQKRADAYRELIDIQGQPYSKENAEAVERTKNYIKVLDNNIKENESIVEAARRRREVLDEEVLAGQRLAQAEREFAESIRRNEEEQMRMHHEASQQNIRAYRDEQRRYNERIRQRDVDLQRDETSRSTQRILGQIMTRSFIGDLSQDSVYSGLWNGVELDSPLGPKGGPTRQNAMTPAWWFQLAKDRRIELELMHGRIQRENNPDQLQKLYDQRSLIQSQFSSFMQIAQALKIQALNYAGQPVNRVDLQGLTSLAGKGGWMGEQYRQPEYMSTLEKMYDTLKSIDDNTRAAEKSVWQ